MAIHRRELNREPDLGVKEITEIIERDDIQVVSFDLFDTLLTRPSIVPKDIFLLLQEKVRSEHQLDFLNLRYNAEEELGNEFATLDEIWSYISTKEKVDARTALALEELELQLECDLLTPRRDTKLLYEAARSAGKRIIVVSDMYIPSEALHEILRDKGFDAVDQIYVSCEKKARKSNGELYDIVLKEEKLQSPAGLLHIGDNFDSDCKAALEKGICAVYYPSVWDMVMDKDSPWGKALRNHGISTDPITRILVSFAFLYEWNRSDELLYGKKMFPSLETYAALFLAPLLTKLAVELVTDEEIQKTYSVLNFAARDGYLPQKVYDIVGKRANAIPSRYLYVSRQALCFAAFESFSDYFTKARWEGDEYSLEAFLQIFVVDTDLREKLLSRLTETERKTDLCHDAVGTLRILKRSEKELEAYFKKQKELSKRWYRSIFQREKDRQVVFDCGYSGSVSVGLGKATDGIFDKYYLWETDGNRKLDQINSTRTFTFFRGEPYLGFNIILEECFSPCEGSCLGFAEKNEGIVPVLETVDASPEMRRDLQTLDDICINYAKSFERTFHSYLPALHGGENAIWMEVARSAFLESPCNELSLFEHIVFPDSHGPKLSLSKKTYVNFEMLQYYKNSFQGTMFDNPETELTMPKWRKDPQRTLRMGIHLHLYVKYLYGEILGYLKTVSHPFDLYVTVTDLRFAAILQRVYTPALIPALGTLHIICTQNRGRDVGPWLIEMRKIQEKYDLFCHIHGKESSQYGPGFGDEWRQYLLDNLIDGQAVDDISALFAADEKLGLVFPRCYSKIRSTHNDLKIPVSGAFGEEKVIRRLLGEMGITEYFTRDNYIWSMGTMMWYRPEAMKPLFELGLEFEDFPKEPIGVGGTIAHVIERITWAVVKSQDYTVGQFNEYFEKQPPVVAFDTNVSWAMDYRTQLASQIGVKKAWAVLFHANRILFKKKLRLLRDEMPREVNEKSTSYDIARKVGLKNAFLILKKAYGARLMR